jgi:hypothetical protein
MKVSGSCLCGGIRYEISGPLTDVDNCHCSMCRRHHGAAFATYAKVDPENFRWLSGEHLLNVYETSPGIGWAFCRVCGSSLGIPKRGKLCEIALGPLESDPGVRPAAHIFVGSKAPWFEIADTLPQHHERPPEKSRK